MPIADRHVAAAQELGAVLRGAGLRVEVDASDARMQNKIRLAQEQKVPYMLVLGDREIEARTAAIGAELDQTRRKAEELRTAVAAGEVFNITDGEFVSKRRFFEAVADGLGLKRPSGSIPLWFARPLATWRERVFRRKNAPHPPRITQAQLKFAGYNLDFSIAKARTRLGYAPRVLFDEGMARALEWYKSTAPAA
mgnify:CR=1 FL=1